MNEDITYRGVVYPWQCDHMGHMNVMWYVGKFDEATWNLFQQVGITPAYLRANGRGMAAVDQHIEYRRELKAGDVVAVHSRLLDFAGKKIRLRHAMHNVDTDELAAVTTLLGVHMDTVARKACPFPPDLLARGLGMVQPDSARATGG
ncbi:thioesterase [Ramlibacter henchirensis]|uniref:Thioesterase n=1 Tax=Ramlibacter henchirensis TaxID=204072 RepID=A0A4Z0C407_9BURK|nr:thioesterase family protein [Ramlibacter henchirensis]TFZ05961.1 thioesterase [Ramlibacter henchirensis]